MSGYELNSADFSQLRRAYVVNVQGDVSAQTVAGLLERLLHTLAARHLPGVLFDLAEVQSLDLAAYGELELGQRTLRLLGCRSVLVGLRPGIILGLAILDANLSALHGELTIEQGLQWLEQQESHELS